MPWDAQQILGCADIIADRRHERVVLFSDITRLLASAGTSWGQLRVDWEHGLRELGQGGFPALLLTITGRAYELICNPALHVLPVDSLDSTEPAEEDRRELVRAAFTRQLETDWPPFMQGVIDAGGH